VSSSSHELHVDPHPVSAAAAPPPPPIPVLAIVGLSLAAMASGISLRIADALLPRLATEFSVSLGEASQVITAFAVAYGLAQVAFGPLGDRYGKYRVIAWACLASAVTSLLCALAPSHWALIGARLLAGASAAAVIPLAMAWIGDNVAYAQRQPVLARFLIGQIGGFAIGVWAGGYTAEHLDWRLPFVGVALVFLGVAAALQWVRRGLSAAAQAVQAPSGPALPRMVGEFRAVLAKPWSRVVLLTVFLEGAAMYGPFAFLAAHLHLRFGLPLSSVGALVMLFAGGGLAFALGSQTMVRRLGERALVHWGAAFMAASMGAVALAPAWWWSMPACVLMGLGFYMMHNTLQTHATQMAPERRGAAVAAFASCFFLGQSVGVGIAGLMVGRFGTTSLLVTGAVLVLAVAWRFNHQRRLIPAGSSPARGRAGRTSGPGRKRGLRRAATSPQRSRPPPARSC
jgi:predicted MFS family arabinose efflux permease